MVQTLDEHTTRYSIVVRGGEAQNNTDPRHQTQERAPPIHIISPEIGAEFPLKTREIRYIYSKNHNTPLKYLLLSTIRVGSSAVDRLPTVPASYNK